MKLLNIFILLVLIVSCNKKEVQLPKIGEKGITDIHNNSSIWMFFNVINNDTIAVLNKNNKIGNTHLIFNIDKRLPLREIMPKVHELQEKLKEDSPHKTGEMRNYFSYADTLLNTFSLFDFTNTNYIFRQDTYKNIILGIQNDHIKKPIFVTFEKNSILIENIKTDDLYKKLKDTISNDSIKNRTLFLIFNQDLSFENYLSVKTKLLARGFKVEDSEYIYSEE